MRSKLAPSRPAVIRCALYTRKSSEDGLEQEFNSLDAQREACEAYVRSQKGTGWIVLPQMYDDGGISGGTLERPALQRLLGDIAAGRVDTVVVYKVDRLTRSLSDFAKIVDAFDANGVSFVSVTQQFNTTTSMGRLTLNMLLSFAQFEREVTGERIRDKIAASKQKGMWMGGNLPLGYDAKDRKLVVNPGEAETVRHIFRRYADVKSVRGLKEELDAAGIVSKASMDMRGRVRGGNAMARGALYLMLQNRIYRGEIVHKDSVYPGLHDAIIDEALWNEVQDALVGNRVERKTGARAMAPSLLAGLVHDDSGDRMSPTHANKRGTRYRYYVSQSLIKRGRLQAPDAACRVPAADLETIVQDRICAWLRDPSAMVDAPGAATVAARKARIESAADLARRWPTLLPSAKRSILLACIARIDVRDDCLDIAVRPAVLSAVVAHDVAIGDQKPTADTAVIVLTVPARLKRTGMETRLLIQGASGSTQRYPNRSLVRLLGQARRFQSLVMGGEGVTITELALKAGVSQSYFARVFRLSFLAPHITAAILSGRQPPELTANKIMGMGRIPPAWPDQLRQLGLA